MKITMKSPAAGLSAGETGEVELNYARWLVDNGYATSAEPKPKPATRRPRHATTDDSTDES